MNLVNPKYEALSRGLFAFSDCYSFELNQKCVIAELKFVVNISFSENSYVSNYSEAYRYTFNGKERDAETDLQDYGMRIYNPLLGRFLSVDPLRFNYPWYTPYQFAGNKPIQCIDLDGCEEANTANMPVGEPAGTYGVDYKWEPNRQYVNEHRSDEHPETNGIIPTGGQIYWSDQFQIYWIALNVPSTSGTTLPKQTDDIAGEEFKSIPPKPAMLTPAKPVISVKIAPKPAPQKKPTGATTNPAATSTNPTGGSLGGNIVPSTNINTPETPTQPAIKASDITENLCWICWSGQSNDHWGSTVDMMVKYLDQNPGKKLIIVTSAGATWDNDWDNNEHALFNGQYNRLVNDVNKASGGKYGKADIQMRKAGAVGEDVEIVTGNK